MAGMIAGSPNRWRLVHDAGAAPFIDIFDIKKGDRIEAKIKEGLDAAIELIVLLTPWSVGRNWVWVETAAAWATGKRYVGVLYGVTTDEIERNHGGLAMLATTNCLAIDDFDDYLGQLHERNAAG
jgi:hypothetical protein